MDEQVEVLVVVVLLPVLLMAAITDGSWASEPQASIGSIACAWQFDIFPIELGRSWSMQLCRRR